MAMKSGFRIIVGSASDPLDRKDLILELAYPAGGFCLSSVVISLLSSVMFGVSNGSLGKARLKYGRRRVMQSAQAVGVRAPWDCAWLGAGADWRRHCFRDTLDCTKNGGTTSRNNAPAYHRFPQVHTTNNQEGAR